jgi:hypothetical protein
VTIPPRTTPESWFDLAHRSGFLGTAEPIAVTTREADALWAATRHEPDIPDRSNASILDWVNHGRWRTPPRPSGPGHDYIMGHRVVEIPDWPEWMP